jgi:hypothetical protein
MPIVINLDHFKVYYDRHCLFWFFLRDLRMFFNGKDFFPGFNYIKILLCMLLPPIED